MLLRELTGQPLGDAPVERWPDGLRAIARIHRAWVRRESELLALGAHDRTLEALAREIRGLGNAVDLVGDERRRADRRCL